MFHHKPIVRNLYVSAGMPTELHAVTLQKQLPLTMSGMYLPGLDCLAEEGQIHYMIDGIRIINN